MRLRRLVSQLAPKFLTAVLVAAAAICACMLYLRYQAQPWTRDGQVRADVVKIAPRVSGYLINVAVRDNQTVKQGDLLFQIDPSSFQLAVDQAQVAVDQAREEVAALEAAVEAASATVKQQEASVASSESKVKEAQAGIESALAAVRESESQVKSKKAIIVQYEALLEESKRESARAARLAKSKAGSVETAESKAASVLAYDAELDSARAVEAQSVASLDKSKAALTEAQAKLVTSKNGLIEARAAVVTAQADHDQARANLGEPGESNVKVRSAKVELEQAQLDLSWTSIFAPADGYITNMNLLNNTFVSAGTPFALFVDQSSFRVDGYFQETKLGQIQVGDRAIIVVMGYHDREIEGEVESIGYAINPPNLAETDGPENLVPTIEPSFEWIRLAQRVPVRIRFKEIPKDIHLVSGMTVSIAIVK